MFSEASVFPQGDSLRRGGGTCLQGGLPPKRGSASQEGLPPWWVYLWGVCPTPPVLTSSGGHCSGWYTSPTGMHPYSYHILMFIFVIPLAGDARPLSAQFLSFLCSCRNKSYQIIDFCYKLSGWRRLQSGRSWIHHYPI